MDYKLCDFIKKIKIICKQLSLNPILEYSLKLNKDKIDNNDNLINRCVFMITSNRYILDKEVYQILDYVNFNNKFKIFVNKMYNNYKIKTIIIGVDLNKNMEKLYLIVEKEKYNTNYMYANEIINNESYFKKYIPFDKQYDNFIILANNILNLNNNQLKFLMNLFNDYEWGYLRYNYQTNNYYGIDIHIKDKIKNVVKLIISLNYLFNFNHHLILKKWILKNQNKNLFFISICYRNNNYDICFYYRDNKQIYSSSCDCCKDKLKNVLNYYESDKTIKDIRDKYYFGEDMWHTPLTLKVNNQYINSDDYLINQNITKNSNVLDWGCGLGELLRKIYKRYKCKVFGINISKKQIDIINDKFKNENIFNKDTKFIVTDGIYIPIENDTIDYLFSQEAIVHQPDKFLLFQEFYRILKKNGELIFQDWFLVDTNKKKYTDDKFNCFLETIDYYIELLNLIGFRDITVLNPLPENVETYEKQLGFTAAVIKCIK